MALLAGCGGGGGSPSSPSVSPAATPGTNTGASPAENVLAISVNRGPARSINLPFASITICAPGSTSNCQIVGGILVDTGSTGLRIVSSVLTTVTGLPQQNDASGNPIVECAQFADGFSWGPVKLADVKMAGEQASSLPIQIIGDPAFTAIPTNCSNTGRPRNSVSALGANGILGIGALLHDCGSACTVSSSPGIYYVCPPSGCQPVVRALADQLPNPVSLFANDNNGVLLQLPAVPPTGSASVDGALIFGIGTRGNNALGTAQVFTLNSSAQITTFYKGLTLAHSFFDSGSNALFFQDTSITACTSSTARGFYCPPSTQNLSATIQGANGMNANINFDVANADSLLQSGFTAFNNLGSPLSTSAAFDWGLPLFFGRNVFVAIQDASVTGAPAGPFIAF